VTADGRPVRSRHGLTFAPRAELATAAPGLDRLVVPGADAARNAAADGLSLPEGLTVVYLHGQPGFAFDAVLGDIARTQDVATARWVAKTLQSPTTDPRLSGAAWPWTLTLRPILIAAAAVTAAVGLQLLRRRRSAPAHATQAPERGVERAAEETGRLHRRNQRTAGPTSKRPSPTVIHPTSRSHDHAHQPSPPRSSCR
jgi:hypothetical protein